MYPIAGVVIWIFFGAIVGLLGGKVSGAEGHNRTMTNLGVGMTSAVVAGALVTFLYAGARSTTGFVVANVVAVLAAVLAVSAFRFMHRGRSATIR